MKKWFYIEKKADNYTVIPLCGKKSHKKPGRKDIVILGKSCYRYLELPYDSSLASLSQDTLGYLARPHFPAPLEGTLFDYFKIDDKKIGIVIIDAGTVKQISGFGKKKMINILPQYFHSSKDKKALGLYDDNICLEGCRIIEEDGEAHLVIESVIEKHDYGMIDFKSAGSLRLKKLFRKKSKSGKFQTGFILFFLALALNSAFWIYRFRETELKEEQAEALSLEYESLSAPVSKAAEEDSAEIMNKYNYLSSLKPDSLVLFFNNLEESIGGDIEITSFSISNGAFSITGSARDTLGLVRKLSSLPSLSEISTTQISKDIESGREEFSLRGKYNE